MVINCVIEIGSEDYYSCDLTKKIPVRVSILTINGNTGFGVVETLDGNEESCQQYVYDLRKIHYTRC